MKKVVILGHSFVARLGRWAETNQYNLIPGAIFMGVGGRTIAKTLQYDLDKLESNKPDIVFIQLGGNDIKPGISPTKTVEDMKVLVFTILNISSNPVVIVGSIFSRPLPRGMSATTYNQKKKKINKQLSRDLGVRFYNHTFLKEKYFDRDGVHLNAAGQKKFFYSIRNAVVASL